MGQYVHRQADLGDQPGVPGLHAAYYIAKLSHYLQKKLCPGHKTLVQPTAHCDELYIWRPGFTATLFCVLVLPADPGLVDLRLRAYYYYLHQTLLGLGLGREPQTAGREDAASEQVLLSTQSGLHIKVSCTSPMQLLVG